MNSTQQFHMTFFNKKSSYFLFADRRLGRLKSPKDNGKVTTLSFCKQFFGSNSLITSLIVHTVNKQHPIQENMFRKVSAEYFLRMFNLWRDETRQSKELRDTWGRILGTWEVSRHEHFTHGIITVITNASQCINVNERFERIKKSHFISNTCA